MRFFHTAEAPQGFGVKICVHGQSGAGKTMLAATLPKPLLLTIEGGSLSLSRQNIAKTFGANNPAISYSIPAIEINNLADLQAAYQYCRYSAEMKNFDSIAADSLSEIAEKVLGYSKASNKDGRAAYGEMQDRVCQIIRDFRDLPGKHVYFSAKQDRELDAGSGLQLYSPSMPGKYLSQNLAYFFDEVFALTIAPKDANNISVRSLLTASNAQYLAKDRSGALLENEQPNLGAIIAKIQNYVFAN